MAWEQFKRTKKYRVYYQYKTQGSVLVEAKNRIEAINNYILSEDYGNSEETIPGTQRVKKIEQIS